MSSKIFMGFGEHRANAVNEELTKQNIVDDLFHDGKSKVGLGITRDMMPQIAQKDFGEFKNYLYDKRIGFETKFVNLKTLQPSQSDFNMDKIKTYDPKSYKIVREIPIIISNDGFVVDGHHRFLSLKITKLYPNTVLALWIDLPIADVIAASIQFDKSFHKGTNEETVATTGANVLPVVEVPLGKKKEF